MKQMIALAAIAMLAQGHITLAEAASLPQRAARTQTVRLADLDATTGVGAAVLYQRLAHAAENVCRDLEPSRQLSRMAAYTRCVQDAVGDAIVTIDRPAVTAYAAKRGVPLAAKIRLADASITVHERF
jgi:UrcA family protein